MTLFHLIKILKTTKTNFVVFSTKVNKTVKNKWALSKAVIIPKFLSFFHTWYDGSSWEDIISNFIWQKQHTSIWTITKGAIRNGRTFNDLQMEYLFELTCLSYIFFFQKFIMILIFKRALCNIVAENSFSQVISIK